MEQVITNAAVAAGFASTAVMHKPEGSERLLPGKRVEMDFQSGALKYSPRKIAKFDAGEEGTHRTVRTRVYKRSPMARVVLVSDDEQWLEDATLNFLSALPRRVADSQNNLVGVMATKAEMGGFTSKIVEVFKKRTSAIHIEFTGMICRDQDVPLIREVNLVDNISTK